jgi:NAD(P)-dependent dehydrogenase (short-subunit alcohol dehydrogenase family)
MKKHPLFSITNHVNGITGSAGVLCASKSRAIEKAGISNYALWSAVHMAQDYSPAIRVNAVTPGFFLTEQNRTLLTAKESGALTPRGKTILAHTTMGRLGNPEDLVARFCGWCHLSLLL